jgi:prevent-host-death family protein
MNNHAIHLMKTRVKHLKHDLEAHASNRASQVWTFRRHAEGDASPAALRISAGNTCPCTTAILTFLVNLTILSGENDKMESIPLAQAKARLSGLIDRLVHVKGHFVITKHGKPVAALVPYEEWERRGADAAAGLASVVPPSQDLDSEIDAMVEEIYEARTKSRGRKPPL